MWKFAVTYAENGKECVIKSFDDKEEARAFARNYYKTELKDDELISLIYTKLDENDNILSNTFYFYDCWHKGMLRPI